MIKISGLDTLTKQLEEAERTIEELGGELSASFDPRDPASIEAAIKQVDVAIDSRVRPWAENPLVAQVVMGLKDQYRQIILDRAAAARLGAKEE